ncbi:MAG: ATP-binding cassette domain-containing protein [Chloroflexota bacterium]
MQVPERLWKISPATFSGGEKQRVNLARGMVLRPRLLLLDEPTASLDVQTRDALAKRLAELKEQGVAMIGVFHHPEDVQHLIDDEIQMSVSIDMDALHMANTEETA